APADGVTGRGDLVAAPVVVQGHVGGAVQELDLVLLPPRLEVAVPGHRRGRGERAPVGRGRGNQLIEGFIFVKGGGRDEHAQAALRAGRPAPAGGEHAVGAVVVVHGQPELLEVVHALAAGGRLAHPLHGRQQQADQYRDDGDDDEQLDQGERGTTAPRRGGRAWHG